MTALVFGVLDLPYADAASYRKAGERKPQSMPQGSMTTGDVAEILEKKYGVYQAFFDLKELEIVEALATAYGQTAEALMTGGPADVDPGDVAGTSIQEMFKEVLTNKELDGKIPGVPTLAAEEGVSHRFKDVYNRKGKKGKRKRGSRPSFVDTGLYEGATRVTVEK